MKDIVSPKLHFTLKPFLFVLYTMSLPRTPSFRLRSTFVTRETKPLPNTTTVITSGSNGATTKSTVTVPFLELT